MKKYLSLLCLSFLMLSGCTPSEPHNESLMVSGKTFIYKAVLEADKSKVREEWKIMVESLSYTFPNDTSIEMWTSYQESEAPHKEFSGTYTQNNSSIVYSFDHWALGDFTLVEIDENSKQYYKDLEATLSGNELTVELWMGGDRSQSFHIILELKS